MITRRKVKIPRKRRLKAVGLGSILSSSAHYEMACAFRDLCAAEGVPREAVLKGLMGAFVEALKGGPGTFEPAEHLRARVLVEVHLT